MNPWKNVSIFIAGVIVGILLNNINIFPTINPNIATADLKKVQGESTAKVAIIEHSDYQCPFCKKFFDESYSQLKKDYIDTGKVALAFVDYPLPSHPQAQAAAEAANCVAEQNKFWEMHNLLFKNQDDWSLQDNHLATFRTYAEELKINLTQYDDCMKSNKYRNAIKKDYEAATQKGVTGTPTFFINGKMIVGAIDYNTLKQEIEKALAEAN